MKTIIQITISIVIDTTDDMTIITSPVKNPLDDLAEQLRREMIFGRDASRTPTEFPEVSIDMTAACQGCTDQN